MKKHDCVAFLQWALPRLRMRWPGYRRVCGQVCKRIDRRMRVLRLPGVEAYRHWLEAHPDEWDVLDDLARVTISRFYRDRRVFERLEHSILPRCARAAIAAGRSRICIASLGCGSGEEPYSVALVWCLKLQALFPALGLRILAVDADSHLLERARRGCYHPGSMKELPDDLRESGFIRTASGPCLRPALKRPVELVRADIRDGVPDGPYDIVLCRNLAFTYFDERLQADIGVKIHEALRPDGVLVTGAHERLPAGLPFVSEPGGRYFHWRSARA